MRYYLLVILVLMATLSHAQSDFAKSKDAENGQLVYKGSFTFNDLKAEPSFGWLQRGVDDYKTDTTAIKFLQKHLSKYKIVAVIGTWCSDSHDMLPRLYKVLQLCNYPMGNYTMYGVNRAKESLYAESKLYRINKIPVIILFKGNIEIGRITETVKKSVEADLKEIIEKNDTENK